MPHREHLARLWPFVLASSLPCSAMAAPEDAVEADLPPVGHALDGGVASDNFRPVAGVLGYRLLLSPSLQLGAELRGGLVEQSYVAGYAVEGGGFGEGRLAVQGTVLRQGPLWLDLRFAAGARFQAGAEPRPETVAVDVNLERATAALADAGMIANVEAGPWLTARVGVSIPVAVQLAPTAGLETTGFLTLFGLAVHVADQVSITADGNLGGVFGWDGDGNKFAIGGQLGLRWLIGANTRDWRAF